MSNPEYVQALRESWRPEILGKYEDKWIAFTMEPIDSDEDFSRLTARFSKEILKRESPIFAFVSFNKVFV